MIRDSQTVIISDYRPPKTEKKWRTKVITLLKNYEIRLRLPTELMHYKVICSHLRPRGRLILSKLEILNKTT